MIDENKLMEEVRQWKRKVDKDCGEMPNVSYLTGYISALSVVEGMIAGQPTIDQYGTWIPVTERLPEEDGSYMTTTEYGAVRVNHFYPRNKTWGYKSNRTIAWMPLPLPYREEKKDE